MVNNQLALGIRVEMEHKNTIARLRKHPRMTTRKVAEMIAKDHLAEDPEYYMKLAVMEGQSNPGPMNIFELQRRIGRGQRALQERVLDTVIPEERGKRGLMDEALPFMSGRGVYGEHGSLRRNPRGSLSVLEQVNAILSQVESNRQEDDDAPYGNWFARAVGEIEGLLESLTYKERKANSGQIADFDERIQKISRGEMKLIVAPLAEDFKGAYTTLKQNPRRFDTEADALNEIESPTTHLASILLESYKMGLVGRKDEQRALNARAAQLATSMTKSEKNETYRIYRKLLTRIGGD